MKICRVDEGANVVECDRNQAYIRSGKR